MVSLRVAEGDLTTRLELTESQSQDDDLYRLGVNLNDMFDNLSDMARQIGEVSAGIAAASAEIQAATTQQIASATEQDASTFLG